MFLSNLILEISLSLSFKLRDMTSHSQATPHPTPPVGLPPSLGKEPPSRSLKTKGTLISQTFKVKEVKASLVYCLEAKKMDIWQKSKGTLLFRLLKL